MVLKKKNSNINKIKTLNFSKKKENLSDNKIIRRKSSVRKILKTSIINNKKVFKERNKNDMDNKNWSWAHSIMILTVSIIFSIIVYDIFISEFFSYSTTSREKRDIFNRRLKNIRVKRAPIDYSYHCDNNSCRLPNCQCFSTDNPGSLPLNEIPQFILLSINGPITEKTLNYQEKIAEGIKLPNNCPLRITNFVNDKNTDFYNLERAYVNNNEIAYSLNATNSNVITPKMVNSLRNLVEGFTNINKNDINGFRFTGNEKLKTNIYHDICDLEFLYDSSFSTTPLNNVWPFTLDYGFPVELNPKFTVSGVYPGLWEIPIYELLNQDNTTFSIWEPNIDSNDNLLKILKNNFLNYHYNSNRIPFTLLLSEEWLDQENRIETINQFLKWIVNETNLDGYFISYSQLIEWMKNPIGLSDIYKSNIFQCKNNRKMSCDSPNLCSYKTASFKTCKECPIQNPNFELNLDNIPESSLECDKIIPEDGCGNGIWECGCKCLNYENNLDGYCLDEFGKCTIPKKI